MMLFQLQSLYRGERDEKVIMNFNLGKYSEGDSGIVQATT
jgi:hypothetical protein